MVSKSKSSVKEREMLSKMSLVASRRSPPAAAAASAASVARHSKLLPPGRTSRNSLTVASSSSTSSSVPVIKPWPSPTLESHGDYEQDAWLEEHIGGPLYAHQHELPRLPVPSLADTLQRFLPTALPLARNHAEQQALQQAAAQFESQAQPLQQLLQNRAARSSHNNTSWLQHWWNTAGYLQVRDSVVINVSYFFHFSDDETAATAVQRGAALLHGAARFRHSVVTGTLPAETLGKGDKRQFLCSTAYKYMFHATRIPHRTMDTVQLYDPARYQHAVVACRGQFFTMPMCHENGAPLPVHVLEEGLLECQQQAQQLASSLPCLGWLTSRNRDQWANARTTLRQVGGATMQAALDKLQSGALLLCLDDQVAPVSRADMATLLLHGTAQHGHNRWFDKSIQLIVTGNGKAGLLGEHSMMDGAPMVNLAHVLCTQSSYAQCVAYDQQHGLAHGAAVPPVEPIFTAATLAPVEHVVHDMVAAGQREFVDFVSQHDLQVQSFHGYGADFIKTAGFSPDAYVQMAMQVATFRLWGGQQGGTYEATQVRPFLHGRTETTRSVSPHSAAFVQAMGRRGPNARVSNADKRQLLHTAVQAHIAYIGRAAQAQGVDRHFLGLAMLASEHQQALPDLYADPVFARAKRWRVSTSHLTHPKLDGWGFGPVVDDGVGLAYSIHPRHCVFNITALQHHGWVPQLHQLLEEALLEMRALVESQQQQPAKSPRSKL